MEVKYCRKCDMEYPLEEEFWHLTKLNENTGHKQYQCKECRRKYDREYKRRNKKRTAVYEREYNTRPEVKYNKLLHRAKRSGRDVTLTFSEYLELTKSGSCSYCGGELPLVGYGIDRVDSSKGYLSANCVACCDACNKAKHNYSTEEFAEWILRVASWAREVLS